MVADDRDRGMPAGASHRGGWFRLVVGAYARAALVAVVPLSIALAILATEDALELGSAVVVALVAVVVMALSAILVVGLRDLRRARGRASAALERAETAEAIQRARADELARVLMASESLALSGEGQVDYLRVLEAITPAGGTSFLVRVEGETEAVVVAAHGPLGPSVVGTRRPIPSGNGADAEAQIASFSASGHGVGRAMPREHLAGLGSEVVAALTIQLVDHDGKRLGWLDMLDHSDERILVPSFVNLAQLVANQIGVAMENNALLVRVRRQLTEVRRMQAQLVQASKLGAIGELAAAVAHEVNNPLTGILGFSELLMAELPEDDPRHDEAVVIRDEAVRARAIVRALLEFARPRQPQRAPASVNDLARATLELVKFRAAKADVRIETEYGEVPSLEIDADAFKQVLLNLFNNALDAMPGGGDLRVTTIGERERVGVIVADHGEGMDGETRARIFTPFFSTRAGGAGGTGLGLSVSRQIVESHGGTIVVSSAPGQGSVFTVWLPTSWPGLEGAVPAPGTPKDAPDGEAKPEPGVEANPDASTQAPAHASSAPGDNQDGRATSARDRAHPKVAA